jgi:hypothetical protein
MATISGNDNANPLVGTSGDDTVAGLGGRLRRDANLRGLRQPAGILAGGGG